ncbi:Crp/Fnr family transcriptional regulator [Paralimibaculum aggregatum]|uniref:Crp/Fnr family transcriptional regulator n=1 Tax=Paralimibaculum aggregatum TaxID=3036245 RepID=A0ABQ6LLC0_9RHOB|nr:Crp/Fnr family transcriptional regulator [Limibaculum sp. NKW23]GMG81085.1 Crp/Fnr family transcriptional regulator [Limibaculum sp. NKW23]
MDNGIWETLPPGSMLRACGPDGFAALTAHWSELSVAAGTSIVSIEDHDNDVYFILAGRVRATTYASSGREVAFSELRPGDSFGELAAIDGGPRSTNVVALTAVRLGRLPATQFNALIDGDRAVMRAVLQLLAGRVRGLSARMVDVTTMNARKRLIAFMLQLSEPDGADRAVIPALPTQQALADAILGQREAVGREMSRLRKKGWILREGRRLRILSVSRLRAELAAD